MLVYDHTQAYLLPWLSFSCPNFTIGAGAITGGAIGGVIGGVLLIFVVIVASLGLLVLRRTTMPGMCFTHVELTAS